jgi:hypothetical protein
MTKTRDLADLGGGFIQAGTGAVQRTVESKLQDVVSVKDFGAVGDGVADDTAYIQAALIASAGKTLFISKPTVKYISGELTIPSNTRIQIEPGTVIESNSTLLTGTKKLFNIAGSNVHIVGFGATLQMVKAGFSSEHNHGVNIVSASGQIVIEGLASNDSGGDGFYVNSPLADVTLKNCKANNNRRQGLSIIQCKSFSDYSGIYTGTTGTAPSAGVDIEPNNTTDILGPIRMFNTVTSGNDGPGFEIFLSAWQAVTNYADIKIVGAYTKNNGLVSVGGRFRAGFDINRITSTTPCKGRIQIIDPVCEDENVAGIHVYDWDINGPVVEIVRPTIINPNQANGNVSTINGGIIFRNSGSFTADSGNIFVVDPIIRDDDNRLNPNSLAPFRFSGTVSLSIENPTTVFAGTNPWSADVTSTPTIIQQKEQLVDFSTNLTMTDWRYVGRTVTNNGATGTVTRTLPLAKVGIVLNFVLMESFALRIYPNAADRIVPVGTAVAKYIEASVRGARVTLRCREAGFWDMENVSGSWTSEP